MKHGLVLSISLLLLTACGRPAPPPVVPEPPAAVAYSTGPLPREQAWRDLLANEPGQETLDFCLALAAQGAGAHEQASGRACLANIALLGCRPGEKGRCADAALAQLEAAIELAPQARRLHLGRLRVLLDAGRPGDLATATIDSLARRPGEREDVAVWLGYAVELIQAGRLRDAAAFAEVLRSRFPDEPAVLATLGACLTDLSRHERAGDVLDHAIDVAPDDASVNWAMAWHHQGSGRPAVARAFFDTALANAPDSATLDAWGCDYGRLLERAALLERACNLQRAHCGDGVSAICAGRIGKR